MLNEFQGLTDEELVPLCKSGDESACSTLFGRYVFAVRSRAAGYNDSGIGFEDLVQEGFIGLLNAVRNYDRGFDTAFSTFAFLCIDRNIISCVRKSLAKRQIPLPALVFIDDNPVLTEDNSKNPETLVIAEESAKLLQDRITDILSKKEKSVLKLYLQGFSYEKIAKALDCSAKSVDNAVQRIRNKLR